MLQMEISNFGELDYQAGEAFNTLCTNLSFAGGDIRKIMITSCHPQEGKSFVSMNLMRSFAGIGMKVVLVDVDLRASMLQSRYWVQTSHGSGEKNPGLTKYLAGKSSKDEILARTNIPNAYMILAGKNVSNPLPLLNTPRLKKLLDELAEEFDIVLVDAPPVGTIIDAAKIATVCDGTLFVIQSNAVRTNELKTSLSQLEKAGCPLLGTVLNKFNYREFGGKYYGSKSYYYYGDKHEKNGTKRKTSDGKMSSQKRH